MYNLSTTVSIQNPTATDIKIDIIANGVSVASWRGNPNTISNTTNNQTTINVSGTAKIDQGQICSIQMTCSGNTVLPTATFSGALLFSTVNDEQNVDGDGAPKVV